MKEYSPQAMPTGADRMRIGLEKVARGVLETVSNEVYHGVKWGLAGAIVGGAYGFIDEKGVWSNAKEFGKVAAQFGVWWGWETAHLEFNAHVEKNNQVGLADWLVANIASNRALAQKSPFEHTTDTGAAVLGQLFNPTSTSGMKDIVIGGLEAIFE